MVHHFLEEQPEKTRKLAAEGKLKGPVFVGQGCTKRCGSDSYGYYVAEIVEPNRLVGIVSADEEWVSDWFEGSMKCEFPSAAILKWKAMGSSDRDSPVQYVMRYGKSWYRCERGMDGKLHRLKGRYAHAGLSWNGAHSYRNPAF